MRVSYFKPRELLGMFVIYKRDLGSVDTVASQL